MGYKMALGLFIGVGALASFSVIVFLGFPEPEFWLRLVGQAAWASAVASALLLRPLLRNAQKGWRLNVYLWTFLAILLAYAFHAFFVTFPLKGATAPEIIQLYILALVVPIMIGGLPSAVLGFLFAEIVLFSYRKNTRDASPPKAPREVSLNS